MAPFEEDISIDEQYAREIGKRENPSGIQPIEYKVVIRPDEVTDETLGGILRPDRVKELEQAAAVRGYLVAYGGKAFDDFGDPKPRVGDRVQFAKYAGVHEVPGADGKTYIMCNDKDVAAIITKEELIVKTTKRGDGTVEEEKYRFNPETVTYELEE